MKKVLKKIFNLIPFKREIFSIIKLFYKPSRRVYQHLHFKGKFTVEIEKDRSFQLMHHGFLIENEIFWNGIHKGWDKYSLKIWMDLSQKASSIFDIGANTGLYALVAKCMKPSSDVYAFEPVERVFQKLMLNARLNKYSINCVNGAVSNYDGKGVIYDEDTEHTLSVAVNKNISLTPEKTYEVEIDTVTLNTFISQKEISKIDLIKLDVETHEVEVLAGFSQYLEDFKPNILVEILNNEVAKGIEEVVESLNYIYFDIDEEKGAAEVKSLMNSFSRNFLLCDEETAKLIRKKYSRDVK